MKTFTKRMGACAAVTALAVLEIFATGIVPARQAAAESEPDGAYRYFYNQIKIDPIAEKFYQAFVTLTENGEFKKGTLQYDLIANGVTSKAEVEAYVNGGDNNRLAKSFGMGRDSFYMDHPDLFYADVFATSLTAGIQGKEYVAYLDSSRVLSTYKGASIGSESAVNEAILKYDRAIDTIVTEAEKLNGVTEKIQYVNDYIGEHNTYGFGTKVEGDKNVDTPKADFIHTSYGALVNGESVCEGYAKSFKAVMDRLGIPCVCVSGYAAATEGGNLQPHMWNYVQTDGMWYAVDVTYNAASAQNPWMMLGGQKMFDTHVEDGSVSSSGFELRYPALKPYDFGVDNDENGMTVIGDYSEPDEQGKTLNLTVSYENKGARKLQEEGKYLAYSYGVRDGAKEIEWTNWVNVVAVNEAFETELFPITDNETKLNNIGTSVAYIRFALLKRAPDAKGDYLTGEHLVAYQAETLKDEDFWFPPTSPYRNEGYGSYSPSPGAAGTYPSNSGAWPVDRTYDIKIVYNTTLELAPGFTAEQLKLDLYTSRGNDTIGENAVIENFRWDGDKTITFTLTPSKMYIHNNASYYFTPVGLVGAESKKVPDPITYVFKGKNVVCSKVFNDGRLYMNVFGAPNLLDNSDVSVTDFKDENGNYYAASQRSQLMLVASKPTARQEQAMDETLKQETGIQESDIVASASYEINLQICGVVKKVPNGTYMQVAFGFPEGYSPDDAGTTFKIYHYKHDNAGNITGVEEIPVIITQYGLIARVESFSPFTIVQIKNNGSAPAPSIYAYVNGETGGSITSDGKSGILPVDGKITYDITPDDGYTVSCVRLNGKVLDPKRYENGTLTLSETEIQSGNMLEVKFMAQAFADDYAAKGVSVYHGESLSPDLSGNPNTAGIIAGCTIAAVGVAVAVALAVWFVLKKKKAPAASGVDAQKPAAAKKSAAPKQTAAGTRSPSTVTKKSGGNTAKTPAKSVSKSPADKKGKK